MRRPGNVCVLTGQGHRTAYVLGLEANGIPKVTKRMQYLALLIGLLALLWFSIGALFSGRSLRDWQQKAQLLFGISGMSFFGLFLYAMARSEELRSSALSHALHLARIFFGGMSTGIFVTLWLEGSANVFKKKIGNRGPPEPPQR